MARKQERSTLAAGFTLTETEYKKASRLAEDHRSVGQLARKLLLDHLGMSEGTPSRPHRKDKKAKKICSCSKTPDLKSILAKVCSK